jgi:hypothetical protein
MSKSYHNTLQKQNTDQEHAMHLISQDFDFSEMIDNSLAMQKLLHIEYIMTKGFDAETGAAVTEKTRL